MKKKQKSLFIIFFLLIIFFAPRIWIITYKSINSKNQGDILLYAHYNIDYINSTQANEDFYEFSYKQQQERLKTINWKYRFKTSNNNPSYFEYPPLVLEWIVLPGRILTGLVNFSKVKNSYSMFCKLYSIVYRTQCFFLESIIYIVFLTLLLRSNYTVKRIFTSGLLFSLSTLSLFMLIYERIDIVLAFLIYISILLLLFSNKYIYSYIYLSFAICFKLVPVLLIPIWIFTSIPQCYYEQYRRFFYQFAKKSSIFICCITLLTIPFFFAYGIISFYYLLYHIKRGIQLESFYSNILIIIYKIENIKNYVYFDYGSFNIKELVNFNYSCLSITLFLILFLIYLLFFIILKRNSFNKEDKNFIIHRFVFLVLLVFLIFSKVFSPQFMIWLIPLLALELIINTKQKISYILMFSMITTGFLFYKYKALTTCSSIGILILSLRNLSILTLVALCFIDIYKKTAKHKDIW